MAKSRHSIVGLISIFAILFSQLSTTPVQAFAVIEISSAEQLNNIRNAGLSGNYMLMNDIDLSVIGVWTPLGTSSTPFTGTFTGAGHTIFNLVISNTQTSDQGLFGVIDTGASVSNLQIKNANITAADNAGILAGTNKGTISSVFAQGVISGATSVGGLVGTNSGSIYNSYAMATVSGKDKAGGLVGNNDSTGTLTNTYAVSTVSGAVTNNYLVFDGIDDYISIPHNVAYDIDDYTLEAWFQWTPIKENDSDTNEWDNVSFIVGKGLENFEIHTGGGSGTYGIRFIPVNRAQEAGGNIAAYNDVHNVLQPGWNHVATTWHLANGYGEVRVYLNGILQDIYQNTVENKGTVATVPLSVSDPFSDNTEELFIGARNDQFYGFPCMFFRGNISDVRFWNKVRTPEEISSDKYKQLTGNESGLIGYWKLDNPGVGGYIEDSSIVGNDGILYGAPTWVHDTGTNGGLVGANANPNANAITSSYYDSTVSGLTDSDRGTPLTTTEMKIQTSFVGWSFPSIWKMINGSTYPSLFTINVTLNQAAGQSDPSNANAINFTAIFDEPIKISSFTAEDVTLSGSAGATNVAISQIAPNDGTAFNVAVSGMTRDGTVVAAIAENKVLDVANNLNTVSSTIDNTVTYDTTAPAVAVSSTATSPTKTSPIPVTITFSEDMTGFELADITVGNGTAGNLLGSGKIYTADITPSADGEVTVDIAANVAVDASNNGNTAAVQYKIGYDATRPGVTINQAADQLDPTGVSPVNFTVEFEEPINISSFTAADITLSGTAGATTKVITQIAPDDGTTFNVEVSGMTGNGTIIATITEGKVLDTAGNTNSASTSTDNVITYEKSGPVISVSNLNTKYNGKGPVSFTVTFNENVYDPQGDTDPEDVTNPANYLLVERGTNRIFDTVSCAEGVTPDDTQIAIDTVTYNNDTLTSTISLIEPLPVGNYRLFICGTTSIVDIARNPLNGGTDAIYNITVLPATDDDDVTIDSSTILPNSGFAPGKITPLAKQPIEKAYTITDLILEIPSLGVRTSIVGIPQIDNEWDVSWLGKKAGYLYGSAYPTWEGNTVITGHVWNADNTAGIFANLKTLKYGDQFSIHAYGKVYTYEVRENKQVNARNAITVFKSEKYDWVTLLTCEGYNPKGDTYTSRRMVRAVLIDVK